jgi:hypothetical protein
VTLEDRIAEFLAGERGPALKPAVRRWRFLPLYCGWLSILGIRADGTFVRWDIEDDPDVIKPLSDPFLERLALCQGAKHYPELSARMPVRPYDAKTCTHCAGTGEVPGLPNIVCYCGGCGWVLPGETTGKSPG